MPHMLLWKMTKLMKYAFQKNLKKTKLKNKTPLLYPAHPLQEISSPQFINPNKV